MRSATWLKIPVEKIRSGVTLWNVVFGESHAVKLHMERSSGTSCSRVWRKVTQSYVEEILERFGMENSRPVKTPLLVGVHPSLPSIPPNASPADPADKLRPRLAAEQEKKRGDFRALIISTFGNYQ
jgi:hypothetical protein